MPVNDIDQVLEALDVIVADCKARRSRLGFFAALYRQVTVQIRAAIASGFFEDGPRMARLDSVFASRYLDAFADRAAGKPVSEAWRVAFDAGLGNRVTILQDLLLGINAHVNLDLGIAAAETSPGAAIDTLKPDFDRINAILGELVDAAQGVIDAFSPGIDALDALGGRTDEALASFSLVVAREESWLNAEVLAGRPAQRRPNYVRSMDRRASLLARNVAEPGFPFDLALRTVRLLESRDVPAVIEALQTVGVS